MQETTINLLVLRMKNIRKSNVTTITQSSLYGRYETIPSNDFHQQPRNITVSAATSRHNLEDGWFKVSNCVTTIGTRRVKINRANHGLKKGIKENRKDKKHKLFE